MAETLRAAHIWTRREYERMVEAGVFQPGARLELIDGEIIDMAPQGSYHFTAICLVEEALRRAFGPGFIVRNQGPLAIDDYSEPEPDIAVVPGNLRDYRDAHPGSALLIAEVSDSTVAFDRNRKKSLYARNGIAEYWILDLRARQLEAYRDPQAGDYATRMVLGPGEMLSPLAVPLARVAVDELLP